MDENSEAAQIVRALQSWAIERVGQLDDAFEKSTRGNETLDIIWRSANRSERQLLASLRTALDELIEDWKSQS